MAIRTLLAAGQALAGALWKWMGDFGRGMRDDFPGHAKAEPRRT
jgi:hypothetical protein